MKTFIAMIDITIYNGNGRHAVAAEEILTAMTVDVAEATNVIDTLWRRGYTKNFTLSDKYWKCIQTGRRYAVDEILVDEIFRFTDASGTLSGIFIYALREKRKHTRGVLVVDLNNSDNFKP